MLYFTFLTFHLKLANTHKKQSFPRFLLSLTVDGDKTFSDIVEFLPGVRISYIIKTPVGKFATHLGETLGDGTGIGQVGRHFLLLCKILAERCAIIKFAIKIFDFRERLHNQGIVFLQRNSLLVYHLLQGSLYSSVPGVKEDVTNIILNLKQVRFKQVVEEFENEKVSITVENSTEFKAGDIGKYLTGFEVLNPDLVICHLDAKASMQIDLTINKGRGYVPADENRQFCTDVNVLPIDSIYTPIRNVKYAVEPYRVEQKTDYDKLVLEVTTDGSISPKDALKEAAKILIYHFMLFSDEKITLETQDQESNQEFDEEVLHMRQLLKTRLVDMNLSVRALNCLKAADVETLGDLVQFNKTDLLKFRNFGKKSLSELDDLLESLNLSFGTDISKYKLDKES